jgi:hypothetical protein
MNLRGKPALFCYGMLMGIVVTVTPCLLLVAYVSYAQMFVTRPIHMSTEDLNGYIQREGIALPPHATGLYYFSDEAFMDSACWYAFSAPQEEAHSFLAQAIDTKGLSRVEAARGMLSASPPQEQLQSSFSTEPWWPEDFSGFEVYEGKGFYVAHDPSNSRVYAASLSQ